MNESDVARGAMRTAHELILLGAALGVAGVFAGYVSRRIGAPVLLAFLAVGMLAGTDGLLAIDFDNYATAYLIASVALAVILFEGGLTTPMAEFRMVFWPAALLATVGVAVTAGIVGVSVWLLEGVSLRGGLLAGACVAPTDAAAVLVMLRGTAVPQRLQALLEVESGLNDPMSVFLTFTLLRLFAGTGGHGGWEVLLDFPYEMFGGAALGLGVGWLLAQTLRWLRLGPAIAPVLALATGLGVFALGQVLGVSGFLAAYLAGAATRSAGAPVREQLHPFFEGIGWLAQVVLFVMLGLLVTPHDLPPFIPGALLGAAVLILVARPVAVIPCLLPFGFSLRESAFASWVGLRGAVPIFLSLIPALADPDRDEKLFAAIFIVVVTSLLVQGWSIGAAARLLGFGSDKPP